MQQIQFSQLCSGGPELFFWMGRPYLLFAKPIQLENPPLSYRMWPGASLRPIQNRQQSLTKSYLPCVPIHSTRVCSAPLELFLQSLAKKLLCVMQQKQRFSNLQFGTRSVLWERFFILFVVRKNDIAWESTSLMWDVARCQTQTDTKPIGICSEILSFLCTHTLPHMRVQTFLPEPC